MNVRLYDASKALGRFFQLFFRPRFSGLENLPAGPCLLVCNHVSHFDPPLLVLAVSRRIHFMTMRELFSLDWFAAWLRKVGCFEVDRRRPDPRAARTALRRLREGQLVGVFPEGGIRSGRDSILQGAPLPPGLAKLARLADCPIRACVILGADRLYDWRAWFQRPEIRVVAGREFRCDPTLSRQEAWRVLTRELEDEFRSLYRRLRRELPEVMEPRTAQERMGIVKSI